MLLGAHPDAITVGELTGVRTAAPERYRCSCGELIGRCSFWQRVMAAMKAEGIAYTPWQARTDIRESADPLIRKMLRPLHRGPFLESLRSMALYSYPPWHRHLQEVQKRNTALIQSLLRLGNARVVVDSTKVGLRLKYLLKNKDLDVRVIRLIRDGRGVALTVTDEGQFADAKEPALRAGGSGVAEWVRTMPIEFGARMWRRSNEEADCLLAQLYRSRWTEVRYEELCVDPAGTLRAVATFLGLDPGAATLAFRRKMQHVLGNGMRLDTTSAIELDERWRTRLSAEDLRAFEQIAGKLNRSYGYA